MATVVAFHAHPDDEVVLTGGTLAKLAAQGHRTVVVTATDGYVEEPSDPEAFVDRVAELRASAVELGVHRVVGLDYADSGYGPDFFADPPGRVRFARADTDEAARKLAKILDDERADVLIGYEANGGYGHRDHLKVHEVGERAAEIAGTPRVLYATMPRELLVGGSRLTSPFGIRFMYPASIVPSAYSPRATITHRIDVRRYAGQKKRAFAQHRSQAPRFVPELLRLVPTSLFGLLVGREWFVERGVDGGDVRHSIFEG